MKYSFLLLSCLLLVACNREQQGAGDSVALLFPKPLMVAANPEGGYVISPVTGDSIEPVIFKNGDTVNTASRMESSGEVGKVNISESTYQLVKDQFSCAYRGEIEAKGKGEMGMYFVVR